MNMLPLTSEPLLPQAALVKPPKIQPARRRVKPKLTVLDGFGLALVALRERRRLKQGQIIEAAGLSPRTVGSAEKGENIRIDTLDAMLHAMGATLMEFCLAVAAVSGAQVVDVEAIETREAQRNEYARRMRTDVPFASDPVSIELRIANDRIADLEARLYGVNPIPPKPPKPDK